MTTLDKEDEELKDELLIPPSWDEVESDSEFQALSPMKKQVVLSNWTKAVNDYATTTGEYEADPEAGRAVVDFAMQKTGEYSKSLDLAVEGGIYEDNLWGSVKRFGDRLNLGVQQIAPNAQSLASRALELTAQAPEIALDAVGLDTLAESYRDFAAPVVQPLRQTADFYRQKSNELSAAGAALGGGFVGDMAQAGATAAGEAVQDIALAVATGGASVPQTLARPMAAAMRSLNVSSVLSAVRSALPTLDEAESQYMEENPGMTREEARLRAFPEAISAGASTALVTRLGGLTGIESVLVQGGTKSLRGKVVEVLKEALNEGIEEAADQSLQDLAERFYRNPEKAWADTYKELAMAFSLGSLLGGGFSATGQAFNSAADKAADNSSPQTAAVLRERVAKESAIKTAKLFGDEAAVQEATDLESQILSDLEGDEAGDMDTGSQGDSAGTGVISEEQATKPAPDPAPAPAAETPAPAPTLRESVVATGMADDAADAYIEDLRSQGIADEQILEIADNTRALREDAVKKNEAEAEARREVARRARAGDPEARAQLERERGINSVPAADSATPAPEPRAGTQFVDLGGPPPQFQGGTNQLAGPQEPPALLAPEPASTQQPTIPEGGDTTNEEEMQRRPETLNTAPQPQQPIPGAEGQGDGTTPPPAETPAPAPVVQSLRASRQASITTLREEKLAEGLSEEEATQAAESEADMTDPESLLSDQPASEVLGLFKNLGSTLAAEPAQEGEVFGDYLSRTGVSVYDFDTRPTVFNESTRVYSPVGTDPIQAVSDLAAGRMELTDAQLPPAPDAVPQATPEAEARQRKAQQTEEFYRRNQQTRDETCAAQTPENDRAQAREMAQATAQAPVTESGAEGVVSRKRLPVREVPTGRTDESGKPITKVVPGFVNDSNTMAEVLHQNRGVEKIYVSAAEVGNLDPEDIFVEYDETGQAYVVAARHKKYGVIYANTGLTEDDASLAELHEPTRLKNSQAQTEGKAAKRKAKKAGVSEQEVLIPEMTDEFSERVARAPLSKEEREKPESVAKVLQQIYKKAQALASETVKTVTGDTVAIGAELADRIATAASNLYLARIRGVDRKGKFKDAAGVVADIKKKVIPKLQKRPGTRAGFSLDQAVGDGDATMGDLVGQNDPSLDSMGYADVPLESDLQTQGERGLEDLSGDAPQPVQDSNVQAAQTDRSAGISEDVSQRLGGMNYEEIAKNALAAAEAELTPAELKIWRETLPMISGGKKRADLTPSRKSVVKKVQDSAKEKMRAMISEASYEVDPNQADSVLSNAESRSPQDLTAQERKLVASAQLDQIIDWNGGPVAGKFDTKRIMASIADDPKQPQLVRAIAKFLADSKVDFSNVSFEPTMSLQKELDWAGLYTSGNTASSGKIQINVGTKHRGSVAQTIVHEALHHVAFHKLRPAYNRTGVEKEAYRDLVKILTHVRRQLLEPEPGQTLSQAARNAFRQDDDFYGVSNLDELFTETLTNTRFATWLSSQPAIPEIKPKNSGVFRNLYEQVKQILKNLIGGQNVRPDSLLSQAMDNIMALAQDPQSDAKIAEYLGKGINEGMTAESKKAKVSRFEQEAQKIKGGRNYWVTPTGKVIDIFEEAMGRDDEGASAASHGLYVKQWVTDRLSKFTPDKEERGMAVIIQSKVNSLVSEDPALKSEVSEEEIEASYQEEVTMAETLGIESPDRDEFFDQAKRSAGPLPIAYVQAAQESGWARVTSDASVAKLRGAKTGAAFGGEIHIEVFGPSLSLDAKAVVDKISQLKKGVRVVTQGAVQKKQAPRPTQILAFRQMFGREEGYLASTVDAGMQTVQEQADRARRLFKPENTQGYKLVESPNSFGVPARAYLDGDGQGVIEYDPNWVAVEISGLDDADAQAAVDKLLGHEQAHIAGLLNDYNTADAQGLVGRPKIEAFHDEVMTEGMRQDTADAYVRRESWMTDEDYQAAKQGFLNDKIAVAGEYKRMFLERYLTGSSYEDALKSLESKTGNRFVDLVRSIADYLAGRIRMLRARYEMSRDSRLAGEIIADSRMLYNLTSATGLQGYEIETRNAARVRASDKYTVSTSVKASAPTFSGEIKAAYKPKWVNGKVVSLPTDFQNKGFMVLHHEAIAGEDIMTPEKFRDIQNLRASDKRFWERNNFSIVQIGNASFDETQQLFNSDKRNASRAQRRRMAKNAGGWAASGWFGQGLMDMRVFDRMAQKDAEVSGANFRVNETARGFNRLVKKLKPDEQVLRDALGTTQNRLTDAQFDQWDKMKKAAKRETDPTKRQAAQAAADNYRISEVQKNNAQFKAARAAALAQLPPELRSTVNEMRRHIDGLSREMINKGMVGSNLQATLGDNLEVYLNRSYEIFDNPEWADFVKEDQSPEAAIIRNDAQRILRSQLVAEEARRIRRNARLNSQTVPTRQQALAAAQATVTPNDVSILMEEYLRVGDDAAVALLGGRLPGKKDTSILKLRGQIPAEIRALWGEYKDPGVNYAKTYIKMSNFISDHNFQTDFLDMGLNQGTPFLWKEGVSQGQRPSSWVELYPGLKASPNPNPMAGVYGPPIIVEAFKDINQSFKHSLVNDWVAGLTGMAMASKTIYNPPQTYVRNILGNGLIMFSQGYLFRDIKKLGFLSRMVESGKTVGPTMVGLKPTRAPQVVDYVERLIRLGVMGESVKANVIKNLTSVIFDRDPQKAFNGTLTTAFNFAKSGNERLTDAYQAGDDFWKVLAFESERATFAEAFPNATPEALDRMAADRVRDVVPTYSKIPKIVQDVVKKQPYTAPFISWTSEILRTFLNTAKLGWKDATSGNPVLQKSGIIRLGSLTAAQGMLSTVAYFVREMSGLSEEDEERLRRFLPEWQVNALVMLTGRREAGKISFWDLSYLNPYDVLHEPFIAMGREAASGGDFLDIAAKGMEKFTDPWTGEQLFFGAVVDAARGVTADGRPLFEKADSTWNKNKARLDRIVDSLTPGAFNLGRRMYMALTGKISAGGQSYNLSNEFLGALAGQRPGERDTLQAFQFTKLPAMQRLVDSANNLSTKAYRTRGTPDLSKISENYTQSNDARFKAFQEVYKDIEALEGLGVPRQKIFMAMKAAKVAEQDIQQIEGGVYVRRDPSNTAIENAVGLPEFPARLKALQDAVKSYPEKQSLVPREPSQ